MNILALTRAPQFSPNSVENDRAIIMAVADRLRAQGHTVVIACENAIDSSLSKYGDIDLCLSMGRLPSTLLWLKKLQEQGVRVINSPEAVELCNSRSTLTRLMQQNNVPIPPSCLSPLRAVTESAPTPGHSPSFWEGWGGFPPTPLRSPFWLKRGDTCAQSADDVVFCQDEAELEAQIQIFQRRGITDYVVSQHVEGDLLKFYGVIFPSSGWHRVHPYIRPFPLPSGGSGWATFPLPLGGSGWAPSPSLREGRGGLLEGRGGLPPRCFYPTDDGQTKFDDEQHNGPAHHYLYNKVEFQRQVERLASLTGLHIFGGDAIIKADGSFCFIDFNDWPSFSRCREEAAEAIENVVAGPVSARYKKNE